MLATLNSRQIVDEIVKDTVKDNDPHDAIQISPDVIRASRAGGEAPTLAPEFTIRPEPKFAPEPKATIEPKFSPASEPQAAAPQAAAPSVDTAVRVTASDDHIRPKRSAAGKWLRGAFVTFLFAGGSAAATIAWEKHGDTATQMLAQWTPALASLLPSTSQTAPVAAAQAAPSAAPDQAADQTAPPPAPPVATAPAPAQADAAASADSMTRDIAAMAQQIEQLKASIAELKAGQEQMVREMAKPPAQKPVAEARPPVNPSAHVSALPPRPAAPLPPQTRKPKPVVSRTYMPAYSPPPLAPPPPPSQAAAVPPPAAPPVASTQTVADDDGPVVRPPMPVH
ncbi:hypothetical protein G8O24_01865 [Bradyrhizobium sp. INPA01-394B]|uniref:Uncharacterized protein n=1 Tax=Bradyrhizobium campsiandrae TaxID=1729892 RepID=A0ABR7UDV3_9BRAD|nr:hypothetical protein [Bradyrhizobium campsiandrae]MBC9876093.1 hypothetical protein [Bradyrhizobium campsiandrae]MBC9982083.1 hypothetical protein [Bradyrhizobium campsiandrae]